jgi:peptide deformylase
MKFDNEVTCAGLAAPQIGISKQIIVFATPDTPGLNIWRPHLTDMMPKTIWFNPTYQGVKVEGFMKITKVVFLWKVWQEQ